MEYRKLDVQLVSLVDVVRDHGWSVKHARERAARWKIPVHVFGNRPWIIDTDIERVPLKPKPTPPPQPTPEPVVQPAVDDDTPEMKEIRRNLHTQHARLVAAQAQRRGTLVERSNPDYQIAGDVAKLLKADGYQRITAAQLNRFLCNTAKLQIDRGHGWELTGAGEQFGGRVALVKSSPPAPPCEMVQIMWPLACVNVLQSRVDQFIKCGGVL